VRFVFDNTSAELRVDAPAESFSAQTDIAPARRRLPIERPRPVSAFLNYAVTATERSATRWGTELGLRAGAALLHTSISGVGTGRARRGTASITIDDERRLVRWEAGDTVAVSTLSGQAISVAGATVSRELGINPEFFPYLPLMMTGSTAVPATADVYINGQLRARVPVDPGTFQVRDFALPVGGGDVRVVIRDEFGRVQELTRDYYRSPSLLRPGLQQFRYSAGAPLTSARGMEWKYGGFVALGEHRVGVAESVTLGASAGYSRLSSFVGTSVAARLPIGEVEIDLRGSRAGGVLGAGGSAMYLLRSGRASAQGTYRWFSSAYEEVRPRSVDLDPLEDAQVSFHLVLGRGVSAGAQYLWWRGREETRREVGATLTFSLPMNMSMAVIGRGTTAGRPVTVMAALTVPLGARSSASIVHQSAPSGVGDSTASIQRSLPLGPGLGYQMEWQQGRASSGSAVVQYQNRWARVEAREDGWNGRNRLSSASLNLSGAVVALRQGLFFTRPITDAFALVQVPGMRGVRTYVSNQFVGRTNRKGEVVVPTIGSYQANSLSINDGDLPLYMEAVRVESVLAPGLRGAGVVSFAVRDASQSLDDILQQLENLESGGSGGSGGGAPRSRSAVGAWSDGFVVSHWPAGGLLMSWVVSAWRLAEQYSHWQVEACLPSSTTKLVSCEAISRR